MKLNPAKSTLSSLLIGSVGLLFSTMALASGKTIPIGTILAMTGSGAYYGKVMSQGEKLAIDQINKSGGVAGYHLKLYIEDHESGNTRAAISGARKLISIDHAPVILSSYGGVTLSVQPLAARQQVLVLNGGGTASTLIGKKDLYNTRMVASQLTPLAVKYAVNHLHANTVAVIYYTATSGRETDEAVKKACKVYGCRVIDEEPYKIGSTDFSVPLSRIKAKHPDVVILGSWGADVGHIVKQAREDNVKAHLLGLELLPNEMKIAGPQMDGYMALFDRFSPDAQNSRTQGFVRAFKAAYGNVPGYYAANYYELVKDVVAPLIKKTVQAGGNPMKRGDLASEMKKLVDSHYAFNSVYGGHLHLHENGSVTKPVGLFEVEDGKAVLRYHVVNGKFVPVKK